MIKMIVAVDVDGGIGLDNDLIIKSKTDMEFFKTTTSDHIVVMGRKTYDSIGKVLPNRTNVIMTTNSDFVAKGGVYFRVNSVKEVLSISKSFPDKDVFIIGGKSIYELYMPIADQLVVTHHQTSVPHDTKFPTIGDEWAVIESRSIECSDKFTSRVLIYDRIIK